MLEFGNPAQIAFQRKHQAEEAEKEKARNNGEPAKEYNITIHYSGTYYTNVTASSKVEAEDIACEEFKDDRGDDADIDYINIIEKKPKTENSGGCIRGGIKFITTEKQNEKV